MSRCPPSVGCAETPVSRGTDPAKRNGPVAEHVGQIFQKAPQAPKKLVFLVKCNHVSSAGNASISVDIGPGTLLFSESDFRVF